MDKVQKYKSFNTNTPSSESYRNYYKFYLESRINCNSNGRMYQIINEYHGYQLHTKLFQHFSLKVNSTHG